MAASEVVGSGPVYKAMYSDSEARYNLCDLKGEFESDKLGKDKLDQVTRTARSVGCLVLEKHFATPRAPNASWHIKENFFKPNSPNITLANYLREEFENPALDDKDITVQFKQEPVLGCGTAFLIGRDLALTAAHCLYDKLKPDQLLKCYPSVLVFEFKHRVELNDKRYKYPIEFEHRNVYQITAVLAHQLTVAADWAILKLDRLVEDREPLKLDFEATLVLNQNVYMLGHPYGLPLKWTGYAKIIETDSIAKGETFFESNLDAFTGNSGSPVFDTDAEEGYIPETSR